MMGNDFLGFSKRPFIAEPVPEAYCPFGSTEAARVEISRCIERFEGIAFVTGHSGTGKTLLCRTIQYQFDSAMKTVLLNGKNLNHPKTFFESMLTRLNIPFDPRNLSAMRDALTLALETSIQFPKGLLLLIDDAQATGIRVFEEIRQLLDLTAKPERGLRVVLFGDAGLEEKLSFPQLNSFSQRITTRCFLETMNRDETTAFLQAELVQAGGRKQLFSRDVCREIHRFSEGIPRVTNQLADFLLVAVLEDAKNVQNENKKSVQKTDAEINTRNFLEQNLDPDSDSSIVKFEAWDSNAEFPEDGNGMELFETEIEDSIPSPQLASENGGERGLVADLGGAASKFGTPEGTISGENDSVDSTQSEKIPEITVAQVRKAWHRLQQLPEETEISSSKEEPFSVNSSYSVSAGATEDSSTKNGKNSASTIEFGSLDDDLDSELDDEHTIDFGAEQADDPTMAWTYDEMEEVRKAVESANAIPEEWGISAKENAQREEKLEKEFRTEVPGESAASQSVKTNSETEIPPEKNPGLDSALPPDEQKSDLNQKTNDDLWDIYREHSNIRFPETKRPGSTWMPPSYSAETPQYSDFSESISPAQPFVQSFQSHQSAQSSQSFQASHSFQPTQSPLGISGRISSPLSSGSSGGVTYVTVPAARSRTVDELIYDSIMDDTVHTIGLLRKVLEALHEEKQKNASVQPPAEYWFTLQDSTKGLLRQIAQERLGEQTPRKDFYQPETLMEKEMFPQSGQGAESASCRKEPSFSPPQPPRPFSPATPLKNSGTQSEPGVFSVGDDSVSNSQEIQEISELRKVLQDCRAQNSLDSNAQERILDIISRLQMLNQFS